jgi:thioredoxin reductase (NADPH)
VGDKEELAGKRVVIVGGGDSAFDWVVNLLDTASDVTLVHRRAGYRAHEATVAEVIEHVDAGRVRLRVPHVIRGVEGTASIEAVELHNVETAASSGWMRSRPPAARLLHEARPLKEWGFELAKGAVVVDPLMRTSLDRVWACGDISTFDGKLKLIATGFAEAAIAVAQAVHHIRPGMKLQPAYSTNTGVPVAA